MFCLSRVFTHLIFTWFSKLLTAITIILASCVIIPPTFAADLLVGSRLTDEVLRYDGTTGAPLGAFVTAGSGGLNEPIGLVIGPDSNLYVASLSSHEILRYNGTTGAFIDTFVTAGSGGLIEPADPYFGPDGNLYVASVKTDEVLRYDGTTGAFIDVFVPDSGLPGANTALYPIFGPDGKLYVSSFTTNEVKRYDAATGAFLDNFVTANSGGLTQPLGLVFGPDGNLYVSSFTGNSVLRYDGSSGAFIDVFVSSGSGGLNQPDDLRFGRDGYLYITNSTRHNILRFDGITGAFVDEFVTAGSGGLSSPRGLTFTNDLLVGSRLTHEVLRYDGTTGAPLGAFVTAGSGGLNEPIGLVIGPDSNLYVASLGSDEILRYNGTTGAFIDTFVTAGSGGLHEPADPYFGPDGNLYVASVKTDEVLRYDGSTGAFIDVFVPASGVPGANTALYPIFGPDGNLYISSFTTNEVKRYDAATGAFLDNFVTANSGGLTQPLGLVFGPDGNLYISSFTGNSVLRYDGSSGAFIDVFVSSGSGGLNQPDDLRFGRDGYLYIANSTRHNILRFDGITGAFVDEFVTAGSGGLSSPRGLQIVGDPNFATLLTALDTPIIDDAALVIENLGFVNLRSTTSSTFNAFDAILLTALVRPSPDTDQFGYPNSSSVPVSSNGAQTSVEFSHAPGTYLSQPNTDLSGDAFFIGILGQTLFNQYALGIGRPTDPSELAFWSTGWSVTASNPTSSISQSFTLPMPDLDPTAVPEFVTDTAITGSSNPLTPTISWSFPATAIYDALFVTIHRVDNNGFGIVVHQQELPANTMSFQIPSQLSQHEFTGEHQLILGEHYLVTIRTTILVPGGGGQSIKTFEFTAQDTPEGQKVFLPTVDPEGNFEFNTAVAPSETVLIDPEIAIGYDYSIGLGDPRFNSITLPDVGDGSYNLGLFHNGKLFNAGITIEQGVEYFFNDLIESIPLGKLKKMGIYDDIGNFLGVEKFRISGIEKSAGLDPDDPVAFITGLSFVGDGRFTGSMTPISFFFVETSTPLSEQLQTILDNLNTFLLDPLIPPKALKHLEKATDYLEEALDELTEGDSDEQFHPIKKGVRELLRAENRGAEVSELYTLLVEVADRIAREAFEQALLFEHILAAQMKISKALKNFDKASVALAEGNQRKAINQYEKAWERSQKVIEIGQGEDD